MLIFDQLKKDDRQLRLLAMVVLAGMLLLFAGLWWVQLVSTRYYQEKLETQSVRTVRIPAVRGKILDREGRPLAENQPRYDMDLFLEELSHSYQIAYTNALARTNRELRLMAAARSKQLGRKLTVAESREYSASRSVKDQLQATSRYEVTSNIVAELGQRLQMPIVLEEKDFLRQYNNARALPLALMSGLKPEQVARFEEQSVTVPGVDLGIQSMRYYPGGTTAAHLLGFLHRDESSIKGEEASFSYRLPDYRGVVGIEGGFDAELHGHAGAESILVNSFGYRQGENVWSPAEPGSNVVLTIDLPIQQAAEQALRRGPLGPNTRGAVVVMDVNSGDILALASNPTFNPNDYVQGFPAGEYQKMQESGAEHNRATQENYLPGSIFKPIVGLACLEAGMDPNAIIYNPPNPRDAAHGYIEVGRKPIKDTAPPGNYDFRRAIVLSCNTYFITNGLRYAGIGKIVELGRRLHLGERIGLPTRQETDGDFPTRKEISANWFDGDTANLCIGQGKIDVSPLQVAVMIAALANGGHVLWPRLVDRIESSDPTPDNPPVVFPKGRIRDNLGVSARNLGVVRDAMLSETEDGEGTGKAARVNGLRICGKTGTAQVEKNGHVDKSEQITWFASFAPYEGPRYAVVVMVEGGASGGITCAPIAHEVYDAIVRNEKKPVLARTETTPRMK